MTYDLKQESWIPWRRRSGVIEWGPPAALVRRLDDDPIVALAAPRPDFDGALQEFLVGLLTAALLPVDESAWGTLWKSPPNQVELQAAIDALPDAFYLDGVGARFFQDFTVADFADVESAPIEQLLMDAPGDQTQRLNKDLFVKRERVERLSRPAAAMALLTLQTYAPSGGQGHRTSLRGGGPLTTLVDPRADAGGWRAELMPLWQKLWANVETVEQLAARTPPSRRQQSATTTYPWLTTTRASAKSGGMSTTPADAHALQAYFGLPRRIRLEFGGPGECDLTGRQEESTVVGFRMRNYGVQYEGWRHPLSPYYRQKLTTPWLPVHGQPGGIAWRDWLSLALTEPEGGLREPAQSIASFQRRGRAVGRRIARIHAFGYDMDNMKARGWTAAVLPAFAVDDDERRRLLYTTAAALTDATGMVATALLRAVKSGLFQSPDDVPGDLGQVKAELWSGTMSAFYEAIIAVGDGSLDSDAASTAATKLRYEFIRPLREVALKVFDLWCPADGSAPEAFRRRVTGRHDLLLMLQGLSKFGEQMFKALGIAPPSGGRAARASKAHTRKERSA